MAKQPEEDVPTTGTPRPASVSLPPDGRGRARSPHLEILHRKARTALAESLMPNEQPLLVIPGLASSAIIGTGTRAFVFKTGARAGLPFGARLKEFEYETVMRVDLRPAGDIDVVVIHAPLKISSCSSYWADRRDDPWRARNAIPVTRGASLAAASVDELSWLVGAFRERGNARRPADEGTPDVVGHIAEREQRSGRAEAIAECQRCGHELGAGWQFCARCGAPAKLGRRGGAAQGRRRPPERGT